MVWRGGGVAGCFQWGAAKAEYVIVTLHSLTVVSSDSPYLPHNFFFFFNLGLIIYLLRTFYFQLNFCEFWSTHFMIFILPHENVPATWTMKVGRNPLFWLKKKKKNGIIMVNLKGSLATTETIVFDVS